jgi:hypothetical protein
MTFPFHPKIDLSPSFIFYSDCLTFLFYPPTLSFPVSVTPLSYSVIFLFSLTTKNPLQRPKLTTLFHLCAISQALYHVYHRIMLLPRPLAKGNENLQIPLHQPHMCKMSKTKHPAEKRAATYPIHMLPTLNF